MIPVAEKICSHCEGKGHTFFACCSRKALGTYDKGGFNLRCVCCACGGTGRERERTTIIPPW